MRLSVFCKRRIQEVPGRVSPVMQRSGMASSSVPRVQLNAHEEAGETSNSQFEGPGVLTVSDCRWKPKHKVFLCHSGAQKDFVEQLCIDLEQCDRYPFFDECVSSLPVGEKFPELIFNAIKQCQVGVVVLSEEFFTRSKWPMLELNAMLEEFEKPNSRMRIIPLFYRISRAQIKNPFYLERWSYVWEEWAANDRRIDVREWKKATSALGSFNGLVMKEGMGDVGFRKEIIEEICRLIPLELQWRDSGGKRRIEEVPGRVSPVMQRSGMASSSVPRVHLNVHEEAGETSNFQNEGPGVLTNSDCRLKPKHKVFLCHSGAQKDFVEQLCIDLEQCDRYPFFDECVSSLPVGEKFPELIFNAIKQCQVGVVVLSEEFFTSSKWRMLELTAMLEEFEKPNSRMRIIPLFYRISVARFMDLCYGKRWPYEWEEWAANDRRIDVEEWKNAMRTLGSINGLVMKEGMGDVGFRAEIILEVCRLIPPETKLDDSHVLGRFRNLKVICDKMNEVFVSSRVCVMGLYGVGGIGKTTICRALCNELSPRSHDNICHVELGRGNEMEFLRKALKRLTTISYKSLHEVDDLEMGYIYLKRRVRSEPVFLALDNVQDNYKSIQEAQKYLKVGYGVGSVVFVTARSKNILMKLNLKKSQCLEMPELKAEEARSLFLKSAGVLIGDVLIGDEVDEKLVWKCMQLCRLRNGDGSKRHYHPLTLKVLGQQLGVDAEQWEERLSKLLKVNRLETVDPEVMSLRVLLDSSSLQWEVQSSEIVRENQVEAVDPEVVKPEVVKLVGCVPAGFLETGFDSVIKSLTASLEIVKGQLAEISRLHSSVQVFNLQCGFVVETLSRSVHDRLRGYDETLRLVQGLDQGETLLVSPRQQVFESVAFCIESLSELAQQLEFVLELLTSCSKKDWWTTAVQLSNAQQKPGIPRWSCFSLATRACEWSMDIVDLAFHVLRQVLNGIPTASDDVEIRLHDVEFRWSNEKSRMVLLIDNKFVNELDERVEARQSGTSPRPDLRVDPRDLEARDVSALVTKLAKLKETPKILFSFAKLKNLVFSSADANVYSIANFLSQKLDAKGPRPEVSCLPWTFRTLNPSTLIFSKNIGSGASGVVSKYTWLGQEVCVKTVRCPGLERRLFEEEAAILATVQHPHVVHMKGIAFEEADEQGFLVMELMEGDLRTMIEKRCPNPGPGVSPFPLIVAIDIMLQIGEGMQYVHDHKILHRDLKAKNVLVNRARRGSQSLCGPYQKFPFLVDTEEYYTAKLADFGISKARRHQETSCWTVMKGTTNWRAPEVHKDADLLGKYELPADVYSFSMTCYEIVTGKIPFDGISPNELYKQIMAGDRPSLEGYSLPPVLKDLIQRCWATDPKGRPNFADICRTLWQCKVEIILPSFRLHARSS